MPNSVLKHFTKTNWFIHINNSPVRQVLLSYFTDWETEVQRDCLDQGPRSHNWEAVESGFESRQPRSHTCMPNHPLMQVSPFISFTRVFEGSLKWTWRNLSELPVLVMDREAWRAVIHGVAKSRTRLSEWTELNWTVFLIGFPCGSAGKESACNAGDLGSIPGLGRSPGEGKGYPLLYSGLENSTDCVVHGVARVGHNWATFTFTLHFMFLVGFPGGLVVENPPAMQEIWVWSLCGEEPLEKEMATHSSFLSWETLWTEEPGGLQSMESKESQTRLSS